MSASLIGDNVFRIQHKACRSKEGRWQMEHGPFLLDEELMEVECGNCGERMNPMTVLIAFARSENKIGARFQHLQLECEKAKLKAERQNRVRCEHCTKLTRIVK